MTNLDILLGHSPSLEQLQDSSDALENRIIVLEEERILIRVRLIDARRERLDIQRAIVAHPCYQR
ncbi:hypothetical protein LCGC14_2034540 [marine sediment metagenome]|uniref:Uncharacterized protein n=1 Tax=marine sediment metagenome TaxID=412755 RepID=A0A0F9ETM6_9ZZZZ